MKFKLVNRYYCDHCKKSGCSAGHMKRHERGCTNNPNRVCGMCELADITQKPLAELSAALAVDAARDAAWSTELVVFCKPTELFKATNGCAACMLAAVRQSTECVDFRFDEAKKAFFERVNPAIENGCALDDWENGDADEDDS